LQPRCTHSTFRAARNGGRRVEPSRCEQRTRLRPLRSRRRRADTRFVSRGLDAVCINPTGIWPARYQAVPNGNCTSRLCGDAACRPSSMVDSIGSTSVTLCLFCDPRQPAPDWSELPDSRSPAERCGPCRGGRALLRPPVTTRIAPNWLVGRRRAARD
jgi:hypothetical protein